MPKLKIEHIQQPSNSNLCGQCCVAMAARVPLDVVVAFMGTRGKTRTRQVADALRHFGFRCPRNRLVRLPNNTTVEDVLAHHRARRCILKVLYPWEGNMQDMRGHWVLMWDGVVHDPALPHSGKLCGIPSRRRITSYLPFNRWVEFY